MLRLRKLCATLGLFGLGTSSAWAAPATEQSDLKIEQTTTPAEPVELTEQAATPILPKATAPRRAYQLYWEIDLPVLGVAAVLGGGRLAHTESGAPAYCVQQIPEAERATTGCDPDDLNALDRGVAGRWSPSWSTASDYVLYGLAAAPIVVLWIDEGFVGMLNDVIVVYQSTLIAASLSGISSVASGRGRPYVYGTEAPLSAREGAEGGLAYFSGHSSMAFALSTSTFWTLQRTHPNDALPWIALGVGTTAAATVAVARVEAGRHFPSDVIAGTIVGVGIGTLIPMLHGVPVQVIPETSSDGALLSVAGAF
ncbi:MAG TPA: phosphatase PAP2 family protein [Polyangiaceae bacterium]|nr:phosphatase PAP2 family protein [Polyangiaceae bacterium]